MRTEVGIIGAGPAGLLLARLLRRAVSCVVLESRDRAYTEQRQRAGMLEQGTVDVLRAAGAGERLNHETLEHEGIELRFDRRSHRLHFPASSFDTRLQLAQLDRITTSRHVAAELADNYGGLPIGRHRT